MKIDVYCKDGCRPCKQTTDYLAANNADFNVLYPGKERELAAIFRSKGLTHLPVISVNDFQFYWTSHDTRKLDTIIKAQAGGMY